jgi:hypothetical protein
MKWLRDPIAVAGCEGRLRTYGAALAGGYASEDQVDAGEELITVVVIAQLGHHVVQERVFGRIQVDRHGFEEVTAALLVDLERQLEYRPACRAILTRSAAILASWSILRWSSAVEYLMISPSRVTATSA